MADGTTKPIERVQPGDRVLSRDPRTGQESAKVVTAAVKRFAPAVVTVCIKDAATGRVETLTCTPEHPFFVPGTACLRMNCVAPSCEVSDRVQR